MRIPAAILSLAAALMAASARAETPAEQADRLLSAGKLAEAESSLAKILAEHPDDAEARFGLGATRFLHAVERMSQSFYRYGLRGNAITDNLIPFARLPIPPNAHPQPIRYADLRTVMQAMVDDLARAESTLAPMGDRDVKLPLHFGRIRLDLDADGDAEGDERLWKLYLKLNGQLENRVTPEQCEAFVIGFDRGDVAWLRGYCHLLMAMGEAYLAHDGEELFNHTAHLFFRKPVTPFPFLAIDNPDVITSWNDGQILDAIAMIHVIRLPVKEPGRMQAALKHLEAMVALSRESWKFILAEKDDDHEWLPNPHQGSVLPGGAVNGNMVEGWMTFLEEADALLQGKKLLPFWRKHEERGVNLRRVFTEPRTFDLVLWVQGTAAAPYLENGTQTKPETWRRLQQVFGGQFIGFAFWFN